MEDFGSIPLVPVTDTVFGSSDSGVMVGWRSSDTTLMVFWNDGTGAMPTATNTSITIPTNGWTYEIIANDQNTKFTVKIVTSSTTYSTTLTTRIPGASTRLATYDVLENTTTTARDLQVNAAILESKFIL